MVKEKHSVTLSEHICRKIRQTYPEQALKNFSAVVEGLLDVVVDDPIGFWGSEKAYHNEMMLHADDMIQKWKRIKNVQAAERKEIEHDLIVEEVKQRARR